MKYILPLLLCLSFIGCESPYRTTIYYKKGEGAYWKVEGKTFYNKDEAHNYAQKLCKKENRTVKVKFYLGR